MRTANRGNILFLILLAVVLFAALAYAVTSSMRGGGKDGGGEKTTAQTANVMNYLAQMSAAVQRMMLVDDIKDYQLNFKRNGTNEQVKAMYDNVNCTASRCRVFDADGGAVVNSLAPSALCRGNGASCGARIFLVSVPGVGTDKPDLVWGNYGTPIGLCKEINRQMGLPELFQSNTTNESLTLLYNTNPYPTGPFADTTNTMTLVPEAAGRAGTFCGCVDAGLSSCETSHPWGPILFHVLVAR